MMARRGKDGRGSTSEPHPMRDMIIQKRQTLCRHFLEHARQESKKRTPKLAIVALGHVVRNFHDDEKNWIRLYEEAAEEQDSTGLLNEPWMRALVMDDASQTVFFTFLPLYRSGSKAAGKKHKVSRKTVCGGTWEVKGHEFTSTGLTGQKLRFKESSGEIIMSMLEISLTEPDPMRVSLCLAYKGNIESSASFIMGPIEDCLSQIPYLPHGIDYPTNQDQVQFTGQHSFSGTTYSFDPSGISQAPQTDVVTTQLSQIEKHLCSENDEPIEQFGSQGAEVYNELWKLAQPPTGMSHQADEPNNEAPEMNKANEKGVSHTGLMTSSSQNWHEPTQLPQHPATEVAHNDAVTQKTHFPPDMRADELPDDDNGLMQNQMDQEAPKNCTQMGIGNVAYSSSNIQSKSLRDYLVRAMSRHVDAYLQDYPLEAAKIPDQSKDDNKFIEGCVVRMLVGLGILPHIMESKYSVDENKRLGKRKVGPEGSSQVFDEENKKARIYEEPNNIENNLMHDFSNRGTTYSIDPSGISQEPQTDVVTTQLSQHQPDIKTGPTSTSVGYPTYSGAPTNHAARGNEEQQQNAPSENLLRNGIFTSTQNPLREVVQPYLENDSDASMQNQPPQLPMHPATEVAHTVELGLQYPTTIVAPSPSNGFHDNDAVAQKGMLISTNQYGSSVESQFQQDLQAIGGNTSHTVPGQAYLQPVPEPENDPEMNAIIEELARQMNIPTQDQVQHFLPVGINEDPTTVLADSPSNGFPDNDAVPQKPPFPQDMRTAEFTTYEFPDEDYSPMQNQKDQSIWIRDGAGSGNNDKFEDLNDNDLGHFS